MQKHIKHHNKDERHNLLEKYTSHFIWKGVCERELETEQNYNILTPTLMAITTFLSRSPGLLNRGPGGPACLGYVLIPASSLQLVWSPTLNRGPEVLAFSTASCHQRVWSPNCWLPVFTEFNVHLLVEVTITLIQPVHGQGYIVIFLERMHLLFT